MSVLFSFSFSSAAKPFLALAFLAATFCCLASQPAAGQQSSVQSKDAPAAPPPLITQPVDESQLTVLQGNTHPLARPQFDLGTAPATLPMRRMLLVLKRSPEQESALRQLLDNQQDKSSPSYHQWLTPEQFGKQFGPTAADLQTITAWLQSHGLQVGSTNGRTVLEFSGSAGQVQEAFHTTIHKYLVNGEQHWANSTDPQIPTALTPAVAGLASLNNFPRKPMNRFVGGFAREKATGRVRPLTPLFTFQPNFECSAAGYYCFAVGPYDFATIYNVLPLWNTQINGTGQTIAIVGESNINPQDVANFRTLFDLPANSTATGNPLNIILNGPDPGLQGDESEADIDVQWSGAVAPYAAIDFVVSQSTETTSGVDLSAVYIVDNNLAPVMSESYGSCELALGTTGNQFYNTLWQQAAAQGITVFIAAGDNGSAGCDDFDAQAPSPAQFGLQVSGYASTPYNVAVGGTDFNDITDPTTYWSTTNNPTTQASALGYIPETTWNSSCTNEIFVTLGYGPNPEADCNSPRVTPWVIPLGGSGGMSNCTTPSGSTPTSCSGGYGKPSWQTGTGVPNDGKRDLPDVSLFASSGFAGSFYVICQSDQTNGSCNLASEQFLGFGGTSVSSPAFAGIMALVNQQTGSRQGNANYVFYKLAAKQSDSSCNATASPASTCIFNDITSGTNAMPCAANSPNCSTSAGDTYGILTGYNAGTGYDQATGLGSVNANNLVTLWNSVTLLPSTTTLNSLTPTTITHGQAVNFSATVTPKTGTGTPTGEISLLGGSGGNSPASLGINLTGGTASGTTDMLPGGTYSVTAHYPGDGTYAASDSNPISVTVSKENSQPQTFLVTFDSSGHIVSSDTTTAVYGSPYLLRVNVDNSAGQLCTPVAATNATACPTGSVTLTDNGTTLDAGTYTLNSYGYFEDPTVQLPGGTNSIQAAYAGDNSFNADTTTTALNITPAPTSMGQVYAATSIVGLPFSGNVNVGATSSGVAPTGSVTFLVNGNPVPGTVSYQGTAGSASNPIVGLLATLNSSSSPFPTAGNYTVTASYSGDTNYGASSAQTTALTVQYPQPVVLPTPASQSVPPGGIATVTALVDTTNKTVYPTGTVTFSNSNTGTFLSGPTACTSVTDSSGNFACQVSGTFSVTSSVQVLVRYSGDANYPYSAAFASINVPDFSISPTTPQVTMPQGQSQNTPINVSALGGFSGTVSNFTCSGLPAETTCSFNPTQVTGSGSTTLTITTAALGQIRRRASGEMERKTWIASAIFPLLGLCLIGIPAAGRRRRMLPTLMLIAMLVTVLSCGSSSSGGGGSTPNPVPSITSLSPTQQAAGSTSQTLTINGSGFISGSTVTYNGVAHTASFVSGSQLSIPLSATDLATTGAYPVVVTNPSPGGGASSPVNFSVVSGTPAGTFTVTVTASSGSLTHSTSFSLIVQ